jgi:hypothetical protein
VHGGVVGEVADGDEGVGAGGVGALGDDAAGDAQGRAAGPAPQADVPVGADVVDGARVGGAGGEDGDVELVVAPAVGQGAAGLEEAAAVLLLGGGRGVGGAGVIVGVLGLAGGAAGRTACQVLKRQAPVAPGFDDFGTLIAGGGKRFVAVSDLSGTEPGSQAWVYRRDGATLVSEGQLVTRQTPPGCAPEDF